jgi:Domain of unknown function (DUF4365)
MPRMPGAHITGYQSTAAVLKLFVDADCAAEVIKNDYGEDLLVQPQLHGTADTFQIYVQVKTVARAAVKDGKPQVRINLDHLRRWSNMINPVVIFGYSPLDGKLYSRYPKGGESRYQLIIDGRKSATVRFQPGDEVGPREVKTIIWNCRFAYYSDLIALSLKDLEEYMQFTRDVDPSRDDEPADVFLICMSLSYQCGLVDENGLPSPVLKLIRQEVAQRDSKDEDIYASLILATLRHIQDEAGVGLPYNLVKWLPHTVGYMLLHAHPAEWDLLTAPFPKRWQPFKDL